MNIEKEIRDKVYDGVRDSAWRNIWYIVKDNVGDKIMHKVWENVDDKINNDTCLLVEQKLKEL
jgi:hypothetical protein